MTRSRRTLYQRTGPVMLRAALNLPLPPLPAWPEPGAAAGAWADWLAQVWATETFRRAVSAASPDLADRVEATVGGRPSTPRRARRAALAVARYAIRYGHRSTPYGLFAGVALAEIDAQQTFVRVGEAHQIVHHADPVLVATRVAEAEADPSVLAGAEVCVNTLARLQGGRVHVAAEGCAEFSLALTPAVELVLEAAGTPVPYSELLGKLSAEFGDARLDQRDALIGALLRTGLLRSSLRAPATVAVPSTALPHRLRPGPQDGRTPSDVRLDAEVRLAAAVGAEVESAATVLARVSPCPHGTGPWRRYREAFADRYGEGVKVDLMALVDPVTGLGFPAGFGTGTEPPRPMSRRDRILLGLAGTAALEGRRTIVLSEPMIEELEAAVGGPPTRPAPHFEVCAQVQAVSPEAVDRGEFRLRVQTVSRAAGTMTGRFWHLLPAAAGDPGSLPTVTTGARLAQLSFHPSRQSADLLTRAPRILPEVVSVGEFRGSGERVLRPADLAVELADGHLCLLDLTAGQRIELLTPTAINFVWNHLTPPLVRFLAELSRAAAPQVTWWDWGAAWTLPFTPAVHYRRTILVAARWQAHARAFPGRTASLSDWAGRMHAWRARAHVPDQVLLAVDDQHLLLDLTRDLDADLLRAHLASVPTAILYEASPPNADGWIGGRAHSLVVPVRSR